MIRTTRIALTMAVALAVLAGQARAATPAEIVARLNAERAANGIPGGIVLNRAWTIGCEHHLRYEELNGIPWTHVETPGRPGFTKDGQLAGLLGDQQAGLGSFDGGDPFDRLPLHLADLLAPTLAQVGAYERGGRTCVRVSSGYTRPIATNELFVAPGPRRSAVPASETVHNEFPHSPGDVVGLPQGTTTGPTIYVLGAGPWIAAGPTRLTAASLRGPAGPVPIRLVDPALHPAIARYVAPGTFFVIPVSPLRPGASYTASVTVDGTDGTSITRTWQFRTG